MTDTNAKQLTNNQKPSNELKRGWTTGACATAATKAALTALIGGEFPDPVQITLPKGQTPSFALAFEGKGESWARVGIVKDAGDDPDVTHGALVMAQVRFIDELGVKFRGGEGVGVVTKAGLPIGVGEPAINPVPRQMMTLAVEELIQAHGITRGVEIEISIRDGETLAKKTWNPRLGIVGGLSVLGTTGIVHPFSCSAWIASIHRGIDVARAEGITHLAGATGSTSEAAVQALYKMPDQALIDMGDFVGGMLKYMRQNPVERVTVAGGLAKLTKLAQGAMDLHSGRSQVDFDLLASVVENLGGDAELVVKVRNANTVLEVYELTCNQKLDIASVIADKARQQAEIILRGAPVKVDIVIVDRQGKVIANA